MKIAIWHNLPAGGAMRALREMAAGLRARGHELAGWRPPAPGDEGGWSSGLEERVVPLERGPSKAWHRLIPGRAGHGRHYANMEAHARACAAEIDAGGFDVVLATNCRMYSASPLGRFLRTPAVFYSHEPKRDLYEAGFFAAAGSSAARRGLETLWRTWQAAREREDAQAYARLLVNSRYSRESHARAYGVEANVCYLGIDATLFQPGPTIWERVVVGLAQIGPHKDPETAIRAVATLPEAGRPELRWIGYEAVPGETERLRALAAELGVKFTVRQGINDMEVAAELGRAAALVFTAKLEPFGFAPLEANACGTPVVAIAEGGVRETVRDGFNGLLVDNRDPVALGVALRRVLDNPELGRALGENGRRWVLEEWNWAACAERLERELAAAAQISLGRGWGEADGLRPCDFP